MMGAIIAASTKTMIATMVAAFTSWKTLMTLVLVTALGITIYNVAADLLEAVLQWVMSEVSAVPVGELPSGMVQLSGLGAWMAQQTYLHEQVGIAITAVSLKWLVVKIPFLKW